MRASRTSLIQVLPKSRAQTEAEGRWASGDGGRSPTQEKNPAEKGRILRKKPIFSGKSRNLVENLEFLQEALGGHFLFDGKMGISHVKYVVLMVKTHFTRHFDG